MSEEMIVAIKRVPGKVNRVEVRRVQKVDLHISV